MANFIFITPKVCILQAGSESSQPDIDNLRVLGFADEKTLIEPFKIFYRKFAYKTTSILNVLPNIIHAR